MYIGDTLRRHTSTSVAIHIHHDHQRILVALNISIMGAPINATTTGRIPLKALMTYGLSLKLVKKIATSKMIKKGGRQLAMVATTLPFVPRNLWPVKMDILTAKSPGAVCAKVMMSTKSSSFNHLRCTSSLFIAAIIGMPPPIVKAPIFANTRNICQRLIMGRLVFSVLCVILSEAKNPAPTRYESVGVRL